MRVATLADVPAIEAIAVATLRMAWPNGVFGDQIGIAFQMSRPEVIIAVTDTVDAFILSERLDDGRWMVRFLMPLTMSAATGRQLIAFAMQQEQLQRRFLPTTECFARLDKGSAVETATAQAYQINLRSGSRDITDGFGTVVAVEIFEPASDLAKLLKVTLL